MNFRACHYDLESKLTADEYEALSISKEKTLTLVRNYLFSIKTYRHEIRKSENERFQYNDVAARDTKKFLLAEIKDMSKTLTKIFNTIPANLEHNDMLCIETPDYKDEVERITKEYHGLCSMTVSYTHLTLPTTPYV